MTEPVRAAADAPALVVSVARWPDDAVSPVCLMIDDLTDGWIDADGSGQARGRNDWGAALDEPGSSFRHLVDRVLDGFPEVRATFFVPCDRLPDIEPGTRPATFRPIDRRPEFARFLRALDAEPRFECAFHGLLHGRPGPTVADYLPEFEMHASVPALLGALHAGQQIWKAVFGASPQGGKYPAYACGRHGDAAVDQAGFAWWCRRWDRELAEPDDPAAFEPRFFGERDVVDVPSSVHGGLATPPPLGTLSLRGVPYYLLVRLRARAWLDAQLDALLATRSVVTVQEHIASSRPDGDVQTPNIWDDVATLRAIFGRLRRERVWHATCGEIAAYFRTRERTRLRVRGDGTFEVRRDGDVGPAAPLSLIVSGRALPDSFALRGPGGELAARVARRIGHRTCVLAPLPLVAGIYAIA